MEKVEGSGGGSKILETQWILNLHFLSLRGRYSITEETEVIVLDINLESKPRFDQKKLFILFSNHGIYFQGPFVLDEHLVFKIRL